MHNGFHDGCLDSLLEVDLKASRFRFFFKGATKTKHAAELARLPLPASSPPKGLRIGLGLEPWSGWSVCRRAGLKLTTDVTSITRIVAPPFSI